MMPLIRNVLFVTIFIIAAIVALANMGMNVTPLLAGAGVIGLAIGFGAPVAGGGPDHRPVHHHRRLPGDR